MLSPQTARCEIQAGFEANCSVLGLMLPSQQRKGAICVQERSPISLMLSGFR